MNINLDCRRCGAALQVERQGHVEVIRCPKCGWETAGTVFPAEEVQHIAEPEMVGLQLHWHGGQVTPKQVLAARKIVPALEDKPLAAILQECARSETYDLGEYLEPVARELQGRAEAMGLTVSMSRKSEGPPAG